MADRIVGPLSIIPVTPGSDVGWDLVDFIVPQGGQVSLQSFFIPPAGETATFTILQKQAELAAAGITQSGSNLVHDNRANIGTQVDASQYRASTPTTPPPAGELFYKEIGWNGTLPYPLHGFETSVTFGKHWNWKRNPVDGKFYSIGGDGGVGGGIGGGSQEARTIRYDPVNRVLDFWHPYWGVRGSRPGVNDEIFPFGQDQVHFMHRSNGGRNEFHIVGGYYDKVTCQKVRDITRTINPGSTVEELFTMKSYSEMLSTDIDSYLIYGSTNIPSGPLFAAITAPGLPAGIVIQPLNVSPPGAYYSYHSRSNQIGDRIGHENDQAQFIAYIWNNTAAPISVPATPFTVTLQAPSNFAYTVTPAELPFTLAANGAETKFVKLNAPSYNMDTTKWFVPTVSSLAKMCAPTLSAGIDATIAIAQHNAWGNSDNQWTIPGEENHHAVLSVIMTNTTGSPITLTNERIWTSVMYPYRYTAGPNVGQIALEGVPYKSGVMVCDLTKAPGLRWSRPFDSPGNANYPFTGEHSGFDYDTTLDCAWTAYRQKLFKYDPSAKQIVAEYSIPGTVPIYGAVLAQIWCAETRELMLVQGNEDEPVNQDPGQVIAISTAPGTEGQVRVVCNLCVFGNYGARSLGEVPIVLVPPRHQVYVCTAEQPDVYNTSGLYAQPGQPGYPFNVGGVFYADYRLSNQIATRIQYPPGNSPIDPSATGYSQKMIVNAGYCPESDIIWMINKNAHDILHWGW